MSNNQDSKPESVFLRTVLKKDIFERLKSFAKEYETERGYWDFGVAIKILLDHYEESKITQINNKLDYLVSCVSEPEPIKEEPQEEGIELLGGVKLDKKGEVISPGEKNDKIQTSN